MEIFIPSPVVENMLEHFHPESINHGKWDISIKTKLEADLVRKEFSTALKVSKSGDRFLASLRANPKFLSRHTIWVLRNKAESYKEEADRYYDGLKRLLEGN